jgi:hypothetical protein
MVHIGILLEAFDAVSEQLEKYLPPAQGQLSLEEAVFPLTPPQSDDSDASDESHYKGKVFVKTLCTGDTTDKRRKWSRSGIQRHRESNRRTTALG